jgi:hypothetical protein
LAGSCVTNTQPERQGGCFFTRPPVDRRHQIVDNLLLYKEF